jgi:hypothetical protein
MPYFTSMIGTFRIFAIALVACVYSAAQVSSLRAEGPAPGNSTNTSSLYLKMRVDAPLKMSKLKPGDQVSGKLVQDVYRGGVDAFPASSIVRLTVDGLERRRRAPNDHWPWVIKAFSPRHERVPVFHVANVRNVDGTDIPLEISFISTNSEVEIEPKLKKEARPTTSQVVHSQKARRNLGPLVTLAANITSGADNSVNPGLPESVNIPAGTQAKVILLRNISASKSHASDRFQARLVEPVFLDSKVLLPEGTLFEGTVLKTQAPRTLSRSGSLALSFTDMTLPGGTGTPIMASVGGAQIDQRSHTTIDPEGHLHGDRPGKVWMMLNIGGTAGIAKAFDDGTQLVIEAFVSTATDVSTAGTARIASSCASAIFLLTRHGRDVVLPKYTQMKIVFDRPVLVSTPAAKSLAEN